MKTRTMRSLSVFLAVVLILSVFSIMSSVAYAETSDGVWVKTGEAHYAYEDRYTSKQNEYYKHYCNYKGVTEDNFVSFLSSGGYVGPGDQYTLDVWHYCSIPKDTYEPGDKIKLTVKLVKENIVNNATGGRVCAYISKYNKTEEGDGYFNNGTGALTNIVRADKEIWYADILSEEGSYDLAANFPDNPQYGDKIAVIFEMSTAYDSYSKNKSSNYGGTMFYEWRYKYVKKPGASVIKTLTGKSKSFTVKWKKVSSNTNGYELQYATNKKFTKNSKTVVIKKKSTTSKTIKKLKSKKTYYVHIRTYKLINGKKIYSKWSAVKKVKTK